MKLDNSKLVIGKEGIASCPDCSREVFRLFDPAEAMYDVPMFALRKVGGGFERKDPYGGYTPETNWYSEARRVGCAGCKRRESWPVYDLSSNGARVE